MLAFLILLAVTLLWFLLPLIPALRELYRPTDIAPLKVVDRSSGLVSYFARNFKQYLDRALPVEAGAGDYSGRMLEGTEFLRVNLRPAQLGEAGKSPRTHNRIVVFDTPLTLEGHETFLLEVYARAALVSGPHTTFRAIYGERELALGEASQVLRWMHASGALTVGPRCELHGRVSSDAAVLLGGEVGFERIGAPVISVGPAQEPPPPPPAEPQSYRLPDHAQPIGDHLRITGDLAIPEGVQLTGNLVVAGRLRLGLGAIIVGSVKAHREIVLGDEARILGSVVTRTRVTLGQAAWVSGSLIAERSITLGRDAVVGSPTQPATVVSTEIELAGGATVYGQLSAMRRARTL